MNRARKIVGNLIRAQILTLELKHVARATSGHSTELFPLIGINHPESKSEDGAQRERDYYGLDGRETGCVIQTTISQ